MQGERRGDAGGDGDDAAAEPVRENPERQRDYADGERDLAADQDHVARRFRRSGLLRPRPRSSSASSASGPTKNAAHSQALGDLPRSRAISKAAGIEAIVTSCRISIHIDGSAFAVEHSIKPHPMPGLREK